MNRSAVASLVLALAAAVLAVLAPSPAVAADRNCSDFATQRAAQVFYLKQGGPRIDPHGLDADDDGRACDSNPCPCYYGSQVPGTPPVTSPVKQRRVVQTRVGLGLSPRARIAGEPLAMAVRVWPRQERLVTVQRLHRGRWTHLLRTRTSPAGHVRLVRSMGHTTSYRAVAARRVTRSTLLTSARSRPARVTRQVQRVTIGLPARAEVGSVVTVRVRALPVRFGRPVLLQRRTVNGWATIARGREDRTGRMQRTLTARTPGTWDYRAVVRAWNGAGQVVSTTRSLLVPTPPDVTAPNAPSDVTAVAGDGQVSLSWSGSPSSDVTGYRVYVAPSAVGSWQLHATLPAAATDTTVTGLINGTTYLVAVAAVDAAGNESQRVVVSSTPTVPIE